MNKKNKHIRQGDVLLVEVETLPNNVTLHKNEVEHKVVVRSGEATGHHHVVIGDISAWDEKNEVMVDEFPSYIKTSAGGATIVHPEHGDIKLKPNTVYENSTCQVEYSPVDSAPRPVKD